MFFCKFFQSTYQVGMKNVVGCYKEFFGYFNALETNGAGGWKWQTNTDSKFWLCCQHFFYFHPPGFSWKEIGLWKNLLGTYLKKFGFR